MSEKAMPSPYLDARREWEERYGGFASAAKYWRNTSFISLLIALIATVGSIYLAGKKEVVPYIVEVEKSGVITQVQRADSPNQETIQKIIKSQLTVFVEKWRNVVLDAQLQRKNVLDVYVFLQKNTPAFTKITEFFKNNDPFERARKETLFVEIANVLPLKENAYQIEWRETIMDRKSGQTLHVNSYKLIAYTSLSPPTDESNIIRNPIGLIINDLNWSKEI